MLDVVRLGLAIAALVASLRARLWWGAALAVAGLALLAIEVGLVLRFPMSPMPAPMVLGSLFLGPSSLPHEPPFRATELLSDPLHHLAFAFAAGLGARHAFARRSPLGPESAAARRLDRAGLRFVALAVLHALMSVSGLLFHVLARD